jgi:shikimate dehydrogenase
MGDRPKLFAVFGHPIGHSLSPVMHAAGFRERGLAECHYIPVDVTPDVLEARLEAFRSLGGVGVNLTRPLKEVAFQAPWLKARDVWANRANAVNTLVWQEDGWHGYNTDAPALAEAVAARGIRPRTVLVLGGGGVARASAAAFADALVVVGARRPPAWVRSVSWDEAVTSATDFDVVVNATPLGQAGEKTWPRLPLLRSGQVVVEWVYVPSVTPLVEAARVAGAVVIDGLELLARQAALAWQPWFGSTGPWRRMREAIG